MPLPATVIKLSVRKLIEWHGASRPSEVPAAEEIRTIAINPAALPDTIVYPIKFQPTRGPGARGQLNRGPFGVVFEHRIKGDGSVSLLDLLDPQIYWAVKAISGKRDDQLVKEVEYSDLDWDWKQADFTYGLVKQLFVVELQTNVSDLSVPA